MLESFFESMCSVLLPADRFMIPYQFTSTLIGIVVAGIILFLVRRDRMHGTYAIWWLSVAAVVVGLGLFPGIIDAFARRLGIGYPPILAVVLGIGLILVKALTMDLERSHQERKIRRLTQRLALLEARLYELEGPETQAGSEREESRRAS